MNATTRLLVRCSLCLGFVFSSSACPSQSEGGSAPLDGDSEQQEAADHDTGSSDGSASAAATGGADDETIQAPHGGGHEHGGTMDPAATEPPPVSGVAGSTAPGLDAGSAPETSTSYVPRERTYFIAADELVWDYAPDGFNVVMGRPFNDDENVFVAGNGVDRVGSLYRKAVFRQYVDQSFSELVPRTPGDAYLGILGPIIHAVVGDTVKVVFRNHGTRPYSVHAHGVRYEKSSEGAETNDGTSDDAKMDDMVEPNATYTYTWHVEERSGPGPADPSSLVWLYHSHFEEGIGDEYAGLIGAIVVTDAAHGSESGIASDVQREAFSLFMVDDENLSVLADENFSSAAPEADPEDEDFEESNLMHSINGYVFGNGPHLRVAEGQALRWYLLTLGTEVDLHTPHWHGNTVLDRGHRTDVVELLPASMHTVDMVPDNPGTWMFHCHVNDHIAAGMSTLYQVIDPPR